MVIWYLHSETKWDTVHYSTYTVITWCRMFSEYFGAVRLHGSGSSTCTSKQSHHLGRNRHLRCLASILQSCQSCMYNEDFATNLHGEIRAQRSLTRGYSDRMKTRMRIFSLLSKATVEFYFRNSQFLGENFRFCCLLLFFLFDGCAAVLGD